MSALRKARIFLRETMPERAFEVRVIARTRFSRIAGRKSAGVLIGPANSANQATAWAGSLNRQEEGSSKDGSIHKSESLRISSDPTSEWFATDYEFATAARNDLNVRVEILDKIFAPKRAVLIESLRPIFAFRKGRQGFAPQHSVDDLLLLKRMGKKVGAVFHGSDIRDPQAHADRNPYSPFRKSVISDQESQESQQSQQSKQSKKGHVELRDEALDLLKKSTVQRALLPMIRKHSIPLFVTTPDLFLEVPDATWLPAVIDIEKFAPIAERSPIFTAPKLRVLYIPSRSWIKSSDLILPVLQKLADEGVIEFKNWLENGAVKHDQMPGIIEQSDVVVDQFIGLFGVFALEAAAAGRIVLTYIDPAHSSHPTPPHINVTPHSLEEAIRRVAAERGSTQMQAQRISVKDGEPSLEFTSVSCAEGIMAGIEFVHHYHDGKYSAEIIQRSLRLK